MSVFDGCKEVGTGNTRARPAPARAVGFTGVCVTRPQMPPHLSTLTFKSYQMLDLIMSEKEKDTGIILYSRNQRQP